MWRRGYSAHRSLEPRPLLLLSQHHSTALPSPKCYELRSEEVATEPLDETPHACYEGWVYLEGCYELAQEWLSYAENGRPTVNRANRGIRILMRFSAKFITAL
jgi:hypothetical protein